MRLPLCSGVKLILPHTYGLLLAQLFHKLMFPVILLKVQEIKATSSKAKTQDMVAIRHSVSTSDQQRTTVILLCEDGSLRIYMASAEHTGYWMAPEFQPARLVWCILTSTLTVSKKKNQFRLITWRCGKISVRSSGARRFSFQASNFFKPHWPNGQEFKQVILLLNHLLRLACNDPGLERRASYLC